MKIKYREKIGLSKDNLMKLEIINKIIKEYEAQGYKLTLRQLYYQLVSRDVIPNQKSEYQKLSSILVKARMGGVVDWEAIEDRLRKPKLPYWVSSVQGAVKDTIRQYRLNRQKGQPNYIEVWSEKDALSNVLYRITAEYHIRLMINRGYSSCTAMHDGHTRFDRRNKPIVILYLGDHDPSGLDMVRDVADRQEEFGSIPEVVHIALTREQIEKYNPPPNFAKTTDPRGTGYINEHGNSSWEVDALPPEVLHKLLTDAIVSRMDMNLYDKVLDQEEEDKDKLRDFAEDIDD